MNSWKLNSIANLLLRKAITAYFKLEMESVYRAVKFVDNNTGVITMYNDKKYKLTLKEIQDE